MSDEFEKPFSLLKLITEDKEYNRDELLTAFYHWKLKNNCRIINILNNPEKTYEEKNKIIWKEFILYMFPNVDFFINNINYCRQRLLKFISVE